MFILEPSPASQALARKKVDVCEYPDGRLEIQHEGTVLAYRMFDKMRRVNQAAVVDNKHLDAALALARVIQQTQLSIGVQKGPPIGVQKGPPSSSSVTGMGVAPFALVAA